MLSLRCLQGGGDSSTMSPSAISRPGGNDSMVWVRAGGFSFPGRQARRCPAMVGRRLVPGPACGRTAPKRHRPGDARLHIQELRARFEGARQARCASPGRRTCLSASPPVEGAGKGAGNSGRCGSRPRAPRQRCARRWRAGPVRRRPAGSGSRFSLPCDVQVGRYVAWRPGRALDRAVG